MARDYTTAKDDSAIDKEHNIRQQVLDAIQLADELHTTEVVGIGLEETLGGILDSKGPSPKCLAYLYEQTLTPVFVESNVSIILVVVIMTIYTIYGVSNAFVDELLQYLSTSLFPKGNALPSKRYNAKSMVENLGLLYSVIHYCPDGCMLSRGDLEKHDTCTK